jgi:exodeoxyribonuclease V alpha subunit
MSAQDEKQVLAGLVERVTFHNEENGFSVLRVKVRGQKDLVTVLGHGASISAGEWVTASGPVYAKRLMLALATQRM